MTDFALQPDHETGRFEYKASDEELELMRKLRVLNFQIDKTGIWVTYVQNNKFVEQKERYLTLLEALNNIPGK